MNIIGNVIKNALGLTNSISSLGNATPVEKQEEQLKGLLEKAQRTSFGLYYNFAEILKSDDPVKEYQKRVPLHDYDKIAGEWWGQTLINPDITWPGSPGFFARTSGTTGSEPKRIPVTDDMIQSIRSVGTAMLKSVSNFDLPPEFFEKQILMLGSSTDLDEISGRKEGDISGISAGNIPGWFETVYKPGKEISAIEDWDQRIERIAHEAPNWDIGAMSGIPSWTLAMLKKIIEINGVDTIHDLWPGLRVYATGGVAFEPFLPSFEELFGEEVIFMDTYLASEGFFAYNARPETSAMKLALEHGVFFEFIPFDERGFDEAGDLKEDPQVLTLAEVDDQTDYALIVTTPAGNYRFMIGDTVRFADLEEYEIKITGRTKYFLNVVGSQLSEDKMNAAIKHVEESLNLPVEEFTLAAVKDEKEDYYHEWVIGVEDSYGEKIDNERVARAIDDYLADNNKNYGKARRKALMGVKVWVVKTEKFHDWHARKRKKGGQVKTVKLMKEEDFKEFRDFVTA